METKFVIVVEVDNKRAHAAYLKGLDDLDLIWPQLMESAGKVDEAHNARIAEAREKVARETAEEMAQHAAYTAALKEWKESCTLFRGDPPQSPWPRYPSMRWDLFDYPDRQRLSYESIRAELKRMADLAGAALGPYRMTESAVHEMIEWESGARIQRLKDDMRKVVD